MDTKVLNPDKWGLVCHEFEAETGWYELKLYFTENSWYTGKEKTVYLVVYEGWVKPDWNGEAWWSPEWKNENWKKPDLNDENWDNPGWNDRNDEKQDNNKQENKNQNNNGKDKNNGKKK